ncbi:MAG: tRNA (adenosine(37)-N6)-threonylcarbamoyltransferase complex dimerization subunit type 1 TsaB, partial [Bacteroidales bacterium]|nr:tRNA (adenosine(37)-N6)-threonylcarbamoyltransferase complex dimerization subunit type 1 TsaB [Bacteroidales bacterium]
LEADSYRAELEAGNVLFIGTGTKKFQDICPHPNASFRECPPLATAMAGPALEALQKKEFKDVAYFEPFYLKEFVAGVSKHAVL